jgi:hypothetical protein
MKFCSECGTTTVAGVSSAPKTPVVGFASKESTEGMQLPPVQLPSGYAAYQGGGAGIGSGGRNIIAGDQNITHSTVVHNQDQTKEVRQCAVSGRQAEVTRGHVCPSCERWVHEDYYDRAQMCCDHCSTAQAKRSIEQFEGTVQQFLSDGVINKEELIELRSLGDNLGLSLPEQDTIIAQFKQEKLRSTSTQRAMSLIDKTRWKAVLRAVENKVFSTDPVAGRVHMDSLKALHKSYPEDQTMASLLVSILSEEMCNDPVQLLPEVERVLNASCFAHDTPRKYLTRAVFYRGCALLGQANVPHSNGKGNWGDVFEQFGEELREAANTLESMFPNSEECHALQVAMMIDSYLVSKDESIREEINLLLEEAARAAGESDVGMALKAAHANATDGRGWGADREMTIGQGLARAYFTDLFSLNLLTLLKMIKKEDEVQDDQHVIDLRYDLEISLEEAARGVEKELEIERYMPCDSCGSKGTKGSGGVKTCQTCGGHGVVSRQSGIFIQQTTCPECRGAGETISDPCKSCNGEGRVQKESRIRLRIPAGVDTGTRLRSTGNGDAGVRGGASGDLYVFLHVETDAGIEIRTAVEYVIKHAGNHCATLDVINSEIWIQIMDCSINCYYPHKESPNKLYPDLINHPIVAELEDFGEETHMHVTLNEMNQIEITSWIKQYFTKVLSIDLNTSKITHYTEDLS